MTRHRVIISASASHAITGHAEESAPLEVGGLLIGGRLDDLVLVEHAVPVPADVQTTHRLSLSRDARDSALKDFLRAKNDGRLGYVGTWHSHTGPAGISPQDRWTFRLEAITARDLVAMIVVVHYDDGWTTSAMVGRRLSVSRATVERPL